MSKRSANKPVVGRQAQLPLHRAFKISMNSLKIRFWRSMVTAGGIFLGIAFLATVLTQYLMQWPIAPKVTPGYVQVDGQVKGPGTQDVYKPIPVEVGLASGISEEVIKKSLLADETKFSLATIIIGQFKEKNAVKNLARAKEEWKSLQLFEKDLPLYLSIFAGADIKIADAVKAGVPESLAKKASRLCASCSAASVADYLREHPGNIDPIFIATALNKNISKADAAKAGIPKELVAMAMAAVPSGSVAAVPNAVNAASKTPGTFKGTELNTVLRDNPDMFGESGVVERLREHLPVFADIANARDVNVDDAIAAGLPKKVARKFEHEYPVFNGLVMVDLLREDASALKPIYADAAMDQDISISEANRAGVPLSISKRLVGTGKAFKAAALNDAIFNHPMRIKALESRVKCNAVFNQVKSTTIDKLAQKYAITLDEALALAKNPDMRTADMGNIMIVNTDGRKIAANIIKNRSAGSTKLESGDYVFVSDRNSKYRMIWLVVMSLLVCTVGITNSMLMAVTERFKEIGTMKCLGALDSFVVILFLIESGLLGICASVMGWVVGFGSIVLMAGITRGWDMVTAMSAVGILQTFLISVGAGMLLTILATIAPAKRAAGMPAAMALRSEI